MLAAIKQERLRWSSLYSERDLYKTAVRLYTKPLFNWHKALGMSHDQRTLYDFARHGLQNLEKIHHALARQEFAFRPGLALHRNFNGKRRTLYVYPWEERLVDLLLYRLLNTRLNGWFRPQSYAYRLSGAGLDCCQRKVARALATAPKPLYVVKRDIADYFGSVDHDILLAKLDALVGPDDYLMTLLRTRVRFTFHDDDRLCTAERGIPFGTAIACFFANVYLTELDRQLGAIPKLTFFRYADDLLAMSSDRAAAGHAADCIEHELAALKLRSKPTHEVDLALAATPNGDERFKGDGRFRFLGLEFRADGVVGLSRDKRRKICNLFRYAFNRRQRRIRQIKDPRKRAEFVIQVAHRVIEDGLRNVAIIDYYLKHTQDEQQLVLIDRWLAEEVAALACGKGHRKSNFRVLPFRELRRMGLPSLVHRRRLIQHRHLASSFFVWKNRNGTVRSGRTAARSPAEPQVPGREPSLQAQEQRPVQRS